MDSNNQIVNQPEEMVNVLNEHFQSVFTKDDYERKAPLFESRTNKKCVDNLEEFLTQEIVFKKLKELNVNKAVGPDKVSYPALR